MQKSFHGRRRGFKSHAARRPRQAFAKQNLHRNQFIKAAKPVTATEYTPKHQFGDFAVHALLHQNIAAKGFVTPSPIQDQAIPIALTGKDVVGIANTGTGKTAAFAIPVLHALIQQKGDKALIIAPTRELAQQIDQECREIGKGTRLRGALLIGGTNMMPQIRALRTNPHVVIGTPGRIKDHAERGNLNLSQFNIVVLDEVDRMLDMGFIGDIRHLLGLLNTQRQSLFFSATLDSKIKTLIDTFLNDPEYISVKTGDTSDSVDQDVVEFGGTTEKMQKLHDILNWDTVAKALVFDETKRGVERLHKELLVRGFAVDSLHGGKTQGQRQRALDRFKNGQVAILVATDVAARGIDVDNVTHVINFSVPSTYDDYVHRIGRAGRAGKTGQALTFIER